MIPLKFERTVTIMNGTLLVSIPRELAKFAEIEQGDTCEITVKKLKKEISAPSVDTKE